MKRRFIASGVLVAIALTIGAGLAFGQDISDTALFYAAFDMIWLILSAALVFFMQAGFAMVEAGLTRAKNAGNIIMKNLMDFSAGAIAYWAVGWALMYGSSVGGFFGSSGFFLSYTNEGIAGYLGVAVSEVDGTSMPAIFRDWMFQVVFAATAATIVSGAMAERTQFRGYLIYSVFISALIYPISGHWVWGGGWLAELGFHDFAGSTIVHSTGGWAALAGAIVIGARKGKYVKVGDQTTVRAIPGHNLPLAALGVFILWFGWYGFNAGSTLSGTDLDIAWVATTTTLSASAGAVLAMLTSWLMDGKPDPSMALNGALAGLVGITAGTWVIAPGMSVFVGAVSGILVVLSVKTLDQIFHIDDPVGAVSVHGIVGVWGTLAVGLFGDLDKIGSGLGRGGQIAVQAAGIGAFFAWVFVTAFILFSILKATGALRVSEEDEQMGLDISEHGTESYSGFQIFSTM